MIPKQLFISETKLWKDTDQKHHSPAQATSKIPIKTSSVELSGETCLAIVSIY